MCREGFQKDESLWLMLVGVNDVLFESCLVYIVFLLLVLEIVDVSTFII